MDVSRIENSFGGAAVERPGHQNLSRLCLYYKEEHCAAPNIRFKACRNCCRINPHLAASNLFERIKQLAAEIFNLQEPEQPPRE